MVLYPLVGLDECLALLVAGVVSGFLPMVVGLWRTCRRFDRHVDALQAHMRWLRERSDTEPVTVVAEVLPVAPPPEGPGGESDLLEALETQLRAWNLLLDRAYHTCNANRFFDDFMHYAHALDKDRSLFVLLQYAVNGRYGLVDRLRERHPALTQYELDMLCMLRFGFTFNSIRLLHHHDNVNSLYSRRAKIHRKMHLPRHYPIETYLSEFSEADDASFPSSGF